MQGDSTLKVGVIGLGRMGARHVAALETLGYKLYAVCDLRGEALQAYERRSQLLFREWQEMLAQCPLDLLIVATNTPGRAEIVTTAARAGIRRILCEKPIAGSLQEASKIVAIGQRRDMRICVNHSFRYYDGYARLKELIRGGAIGDLRAMTYIVGAGGLANLGIHIFDLFRYLTDDEVESAVGWIRPMGTVNPRGRQFEDPGGFGVFTFGKGSRAFVDISDDVGVQPNMELVGNYGRVRINPLANQWEVHARSIEDRRLPLAHYGTPLEHIDFDPGKIEIIDLIHLSARAIQELLSDEPIRATPEDGFRALEMYVALRWSHMNGSCPVALPLPAEAGAMTFPLP